VQFHIYEQLTETGEAEEWGSSPATGGEEVDE